MRIFTDQFAIEAAKRSITPLWVLKCEFDSGTKYLSDSVFSVPVWDGGITTLAWVSKWSTLSERIGLDISSTSLTKFELVMLNDNDVSPNLDSIFWDDDERVEADTCTLYLWFDGLNPATDPPYSIWSGNITDFKKLNEIEYQVNFSDLSERANKKIGTKLNPDDYPDITSGVTGDMANIIYGQVSNVKCVSLNTGTFTNLSESVTSVGTILDVNNAIGFSIGGNIWCEYEQMLIVDVFPEDKQLQVTRATGGTSATTHSRGAVVRKDTTNYVFLYASHPVKELTEVFLKNRSLEVDITDDVTVYTGQSGDELSGYDDLAVVAISHTNYNTIISDISFSFIDADDVTILVNGEGYQDDDSGTYTGVEEELIERPDQVAKHFAATYASITNFFTDAEEYFDNNNYKFRGVIDEYQSLKENMKNFALQCRCLFRFSGGQIRFTLRQINPEGSQMVDESSILMGNGFKSTLAIDRSRISDIINSITIQYNRDMITNSYRGYYKLSDTISIDAFGEKERPQSFSAFNLVSDFGMVQDVGAYYVSRYKDKRRVLTFSTTLDQSHLEFGDVITVSHGDIPDADGVYEIVQANVTPGSLNRIDKVDFKCIATIGSE